MKTIMLNPKMLLEGMENKTRKVGRSYRRRQNIAKMGSIWPPKDHGRNLVVMAPKIGK